MGSKVDETRGERFRDAVPHHDGLRFPGELADAGDGNAPRLTDYRGEPSAGAPRHGEEQLVIVSAGRRADDRVEAGAPEPFARRRRDRQGGGLEGGARARRPRHLPHPVPATRPPGPSPAPGPDPAPHPPQPPPPPPRPGP